LYIFIKALWLCSLILKIKDEQKNVKKNIRDSSTNSAPFNHTNFSQTQTGATVSLKIHFKLPYLKTIWGS
jgi:hypothetical protein